MAERREIIRILKRYTMQFQLASSNFLQRWSKFFHLTNGELLSRMVNTFNREFQSQSFKSRSSTKHKDNVRLIIAKSRENNPLFTLLFFSVFFKFFITAFCFTMIDNWEQTAIYSAYFLKYSAIDAYCKCELLRLSEARVRVRNVGPTQGRALAKQPSSNGLSSEESPLRKWLKWYMWGSVMSRLLSSHDGVMVRSGLAQHITIIKKARI